MMRRILQKRKLFNFSAFQEHAAKTCSVANFDVKCLEIPRNFCSQRTLAQCSSHERFECSYGVLKRFLSIQAQESIAKPVGEIIEIPLAQTGEGIAECELLKWFIQEGDIVEEFQPICEVQSDKATIEITSRYKGKVSRVRFVPGEIVKVGETLVELLVENHSNMVSSGEVKVPVADSQETDLPSQESRNAKENKKELLATPAVRHIAKEYGVNLWDVLGTGQDGRILKEDVLKYIANKESVWDEVTHIFQPTRTLDEEVTHSVSAEQLSSQTSTTQQDHGDKTLPLRGFQRAMVKTMNMAAKVPLFHYLEEINVDSLIELKKTFQDATAGQAIKHTYLPFLLKSLSCALMDYHMLNSTFNEEAYEITYRGSHNIGVAMATPHGLVVPNIKNVQSLSLLEITKELQRLIQGASNNSLSTYDISGGTITLSNIGAIGGKFGSPILNLPEVAIIAVGRIQKLPRYCDGGTVYPASVMNVTFGADHRVIDGATVAHFCNKWKLLIENPKHLLLQLR